MAEQVILNEDRRDCLQEVTNIAMGQAADQLARLLDTFVILSIPHVEVLTPTDIEMALQSLEGSQSVSGVCQGFIGGGIAGEAMVIFNDASFQDLANLMNYSDCLDHHTEHELLADAANVLIGACLKGMAEQMDVDFSYGAPMLLGQHCAISDLLKRNALSWDQALVVEINYKIEHHQINCDLLLVMTEDSIDWLFKKLDYLME